MARSLDTHPLSLHNASSAPEPTQPQPALALGAKGFRPFFGMAAFFAAIMVPLWLAVFTGRVRVTPYVEPATWHAHEMIFGFAAAVIAGFLLTAVGNWTKRETLIGMPLLALAKLWLLGRVAMLLAGYLPAGIAAATDLAFLPALIVVLSRPLIATKNRRNFVMLAILAALFGANLAVHLDAVGVLQKGYAYRATLVALDIVLLVILIIAGRVFPMFTRNATGVMTIRSIPGLDIACIVGMVALTVLDAIPSMLRMTGIVAACVGLLAALRATHWGARYSLREPLLWVLHAGYAWLVIGLLLRAPAAWGSAGISTSHAIHALTVGALGTLTLGMMARVALGHTGRPLQAPRPIFFAFVALQLAVIARVLLPRLMPHAYVSTLIIAAVFWTFAFVVFLVVYTPILTQPRVDGKPG